MGVNALLWSCRNLQSRDSCQLDIAHWGLIRCHLKPFKPFRHNRPMSQKSLIQYCERSELSIKSWIKNAKNSQFGKFMKTWRLQSNSITKQANFSLTNNGGKCQNWKTQMRHFGWFWNNVSGWMFILLKKEILFEEVTSITFQGGVNSFLKFDIHLFFCLWNNC